MARHARVELAAMVLGSVSHRLLAISESNPGRPGSRQNMNLSEMKHSPDRHR
jgi:hypothetical protein